jgi:hypothetical protein
LVHTSAPRPSRAYPPALDTAVHPQISFNELAKYMIAYLNQKGIVIVNGAHRVHSKGATRNSAEIVGVSKDPSNGRYFTRIGLDHFVYLDKNQESIGQDLLSEKSGLFGPSTAWSVSQRMAIFRVDDEDSLEKVRETLRRIGFEKIDASREVLETGFRTGDTSPIIKRRKN